MSFLYFYIHFLRREHLIYKATGKTIRKLDEGLPKPFEIIRYNYLQSNSIPKKNGSIKVVSWNIERGYKIDSIIAELRKVDADVLLLQELDINCKRTDQLNIPSMIAKELEMDCVFIAEFEEYISPVRGTSNQGGGVHGNAVLSRFPILSSSAIIHSEQINWRLDGMRLSLEPREGGRVSVFCELDTSSSLSFPIVSVVSSHFEPFVSCKERFQHLKEVANFLVQRYEGVSSSSSLSQPPPVIIGGDLNTMMSKLGRLNKFYPVLPFSNVFNRFHHLFHSEAYCIDKNFKDELQSIKNTHPTFLTISSLSDPFVKEGIKCDSTYFLNQVFAGKLDWLFFSENSFILKQKGVSTGKSSDHQFIYVDLEEKKKN